MTAAPQTQLRVIAEPVIGFLNLSGAAGQILLDEDRAAIAPLFRTQHVSSTDCPPCHVLFLYGTIGKDGRIAERECFLADFLGQHRPYIVIVASQNGDTALVRAMTRKPDWAVNVVLTLDRKGPAFSRFFQNIFRDMQYGVPFALAWVTYAPQIPNSPIDRGLPETIMIAGHPQFQFIPSWFPIPVLAQAASLSSVTEKVISLIKAEYQTSSGTSPAQPGVFGKRPSLHAPSFYSALGAMLGFSIYLSITRGRYMTDAIVRSRKGLLLTIAGKDGHRYFMGDLVNWLLFEAWPGCLSPWHLIVQAIREDGSEPPDLVPILKHVAATIGGDRFGVPNIASDLLPREMPLAVLRRLWPQVQSILEAGGRSPVNWPIDMGWIIASALKTISPLPRRTAALIAMEAAIPMSKLGEPPWS